MSLLLLLRSSGTIEALSGIAMGSSSATARLATAWSLRGAAAGLAAVRAQLARVRPLAGASSGTSSLLGGASCAQTLAGVATGWARVVGVMLSAVGTPANRTLCVRMESRTLRAGIGARSVFLRPETRVLVVPPAERTYQTRREGRSIDA
jgi:hypothetical protein